MPGIYRAPEVILGMEWDCKVDIWSIGLMVSMRTSLVNHIISQNPRITDKATSYFGWVRLSLMGANINTFRHGTYSRADDYSLPGRTAY